MYIGILFQLAQPSTQDEQSFRKIVDTSYVPLLKFLRKFRDVPLALSISLSTLELLDKYGYQDIVNSLKDFYSEGRLELVNTGAYNPLLPLIPKDTRDKHLVLNEYGLSYYFGERQGFEGDPAMLVRNVRGFYPSGLAVSSDVVRLCSSLGYDWVVVGESALRDFSESEGNVYLFKNTNCHIIVRDTYLSNAISSKDGFDISTFEKRLQYLTTSKSPSNNFTLIALNSDLLGTYNRSSFLLLANIFEIFQKYNLEVLLPSNYLKNISGFPEIEFSRIRTSSMSILPDQVLHYEDLDNPFPLWKNSDNKLQSELWTLYDAVVPSAFEYLKANESVLSVDSELLTLSFWLPKDVQNLAEEVKNYLSLYVLSHKLVDHNQFILAHDCVTQGISKTRDLQLRNVLKLYKQVSARVGNSNLHSTVNSTIDSIEALLQKLA